MGSSSSPSKLFVLTVRITVILFASCFYLGSSQTPDDLASNLFIECMEGFLPCQSFFQEPSSQPPSSCCDSVKDMVDIDKKCLCGFFNDGELLQSLNVSREDALKLPKACGATADLSNCGTMSTPSKANTTSESTPSEGGPASASSTKDAKTEESSADGLWPFGRCSGMVASVAAAWMSIFM